MNRAKIISLALLIMLTAVPLCAQGRDGKDRIEAGSPFLSARPYLVSISVADLDGSIAWYRGNLGFAVMRQMDLPERALRIAFMELNGFRLELVEFRQAVSFAAIQKLFPFVDDRARVQGPGKLAFLVDDIVAAAEALKGKGVKLAREVTADKEFGEKWFMVADNSGNIIQFVQKITREDTGMDTKENTGKDEHIDPVCGMTVSGDSKFQYVYAGETYYFCSQHCLLAFKEHPEQYLKKQTAPPQN